MNTNMGRRTRYEVGKNVYPDKYDENIYVVATHGIHFYKKLDCAFHHYLLPEENGYIGKHIIYWYPDGSSFVKNYEKNVYGVSTVVSV